MAFTQQEIEQITQMVLKELGNEISQLQYTLNQADVVPLDDIVMNSIEGYSVNPEAVYFMKNNGLSPLSQQIYDLIIDEPDVIVNNQGRVTKATLRHYLVNEMRIANELINEAFIEITNFLRRS